MDTIDDVHRVVVFLSLLIGGIGIGLITAAAMISS